MKNNSLVVVLAACMPLFSQAEVNTEASVELEDISIVDGVESAEKNASASEAYESFAPVDSGISVISQESVSISHQGGMDTTELLNVLPFVQLDVERYEGSAESEQHIRPSDFSIAGGQFYDNNISIDGVSVNSIMDVNHSSDSSHFDEVNGQTSQKFYVDPSLLQAVEVNDSNVSASKGQFSGGAVDFQIRDPQDEFHAKVSAGLQMDEMVYYIGQDSSGDKYPDFMKYQTSTSFDLPLTDKLKVLVAYSRSESKSYYTMDDDYGGYQYTNKDVSENYVIKGIYEINDNLESKFLLSSSPYDSEYTSKNEVNSRRMSQSSGLLSYIELIGYHGGYDWKGKLSYNEFDASRDWDGDRFKWDSDSEYGSSLGCDNSYCYEGGYGDINQKQKDYTLNLSASTDFAAGTLNIGSQTTYTQAYKQRPETNSYYYSSVYDENSSIQCDESDSACMSDLAFTRKMMYDAYEASVGVFQQALWSEYLREIGDFSFRAGLRYEYEDYMKNHNVAPRLVGTWEFMPEYTLTLGANRYYARNTVAYAIKSATPTTSTYTRTLNSDGTLTDWIYSTSGTEYDYSDSGLKTPYSDELTAAVTIPTALNGHFRVKGILRYHRDRLVGQNEYDSDDGSNWTLTNDGKTDYKGIALEWSGGFEDHRLTANVTWSETRVIGSSDYFSETDVEELKSNYIYYNGSVMSEYDLNQITDPDNFGTPLQAKVSLTSTWWNKRLLTMLGVRYRGAYSVVDETGTTIEVDGNDYEVYEKDTVGGYVEVDFNAQMQVWRTTNTKTTIEARVTNLLNDDPYPESSNYRKGRAFWVGASIDIW